MDRDVILHDLNVILNKVASGDRSEVRQRRIRLWRRSLAQEILRLRSLALASLRMT
jgi:hypothetical protein